MMLTSLLHLLLSLIAFVVIGSIIVLSYIRSQGGQISWQQLDQVANAFGTVLDYDQGAGASPVNSSNSFRRRRFEESVHNADSSWRGITEFNSRSLTATNYSLDNNNHRASGLVSKSQHTVGSYHSHPTELQSGVGYNKKAATTLFEPRGPSERSALGSVTVRPPRRTLDPAETVNGLMGNRGRSSSGVRLTGDSMSGNSSRGSVARSEYRRDLAAASIVPGERSSTNGVLSNRSSPSGTSLCTACMQGLMYCRCTVVIYRHDRRSVSADRNDRRRIRSYSPTPMAACRNSQV